MFLFRCGHVVAVKDGVIVPYANATRMYEEKMGQVFLTEPDYTVVVGVSTFEEANLAYKNMLISYYQDINKVLVNVIPHIVRTPLNSILYNVRELSSMKLSTPAMNLVASLSEYTVNMANSVMDATDLVELKMRRVPVRSRPINLHRLILNILKRFNTKTRTLSYKINCRENIVGDERLLTRLIDTIIANSSTPKVVVTTDDSLRMKFTNVSPDDVGNVIIDLLAETIGCNVRRSIGLEIIMPLQSGFQQDEPSIGFDFSEPDFDGHRFRLLSEPESSLIPRWMSEYITERGGVITEEDAVDVITICDDSMRVPMLGQSVGLTAAPKVVYGVMCEAPSGPPEPFTVRVQLPASELDFNNIFRRMVSVEHVKVLCVDDDAVALKILKRMLPNYKVRTASNGLEAVSEYKSFKPDFVIMDIDMPIMNGHEAKREILRIDPDACVLFVTAGGGMGIAGDPLLYKPIKAADIHEFLSGMQ